MPGIEVTQFNLTSTKEIVKYENVPAWLWPFYCDVCNEKIKQDGRIVAAQDNAGFLFHFHSDCWDNHVILW